MTGDIKYTVSGGVLTITVPLDQDHGPSGSGKSDIVASSGGFVQIPESDLAFGLNVVRPRKARKARKA